MSPIAAHFQQADGKSYAASVRVDPSFNMIVFTFGAAADMGLGR